MRKLILALAVLGWSARFAQQYTIDWFKIAGGGGTSAGGTCQVSGTIGQHDASSAMTGGPMTATKKDSRFMAKHWKLSDCRLASRCQ